MASYTYNPDGLRRSKHVLMTFEQRYIWSGDSMVYECELLYPANGTVYVYGINLISSRNSDVDDTFYLYNAHGDVVQLVDGTGTITQTYNYDAFGVEYDVDEDDDNHFRYAGQYYDFESGTYYLRARYYNPANGRFTQQDGWGFGDINDPLSLNLYTYCINNPIIFVDENGHEFVVAGITLTAIQIIAIGGLALLTYFLIFPEKAERIVTSIINEVSAAYDTAVATADQLIDFISIDTSNPSDDGKKEIVPPVNVGDNSKDDTKDKNKDNSDGGSKTKQEQRNLPIEGDPNSDQSIDNEDGTPKQTRHYGDDGKAEYDIDHNHPDPKNNHEFPHKHTWDYSKGGMLSCK